MRAYRSIQFESKSLVDKINGNIYYRKLYHLIGGSLMIVGIIILDRVVFISLCVLFTLSFYIITNRVTFAVIGILLLLILSNSGFVTLCATTIWVIGDGLAGLVGALFGRYRWPWYPQKTLLGSVSFLIGSFLAMYAVLISTINAPMYILISMSLFSSLGACMVEILPIPFVRDGKVNDNLLVILVCGMLIQLLSTWFNLSAVF